MITFYTLTTFTFFHWLFDFFFQTEEMGNNKSKDNFVLLEHIVIYFGGLMCMMAVNCWYFHNQIYTLVWFVINAVAHFFTDWTTSRATSLLYKEERYHDFFVVIGVDQFIHMITLFGTFVWLSNL